MGIENGFNRFKLKEPEQPGCGKITGSKITFQFRHNLAQSDRFQALASQVLALQDALSKTSWELLNLTLKLFKG